MPSDLHLVHFNAPELPLIDPAPPELQKMYRALNSLHSLAQADGLRRIPRGAPAVPLARHDVRAPWHLSPHQRTTHGHLSIHQMSWEFVQRVFLPPKFNA